MTDTAMVAAQPLVPQIAGETASTTLAAQVVANVQARYTLAKRMPRNIDDVRVNLLKECKRPRFADVAIYHKPIGKGVEGPSIRFAEAALRCMTNVWPEVITVFDDDEKRVVRVSVTDLEANITYSKDVTVIKTVERSSPDGKDVIGSRVNSRGKTVYIVRATDDDILNKENALVSKAMRTVGLRLIPGDILDEALEQVKRTMSDSAAKDPDAERKRIVDSFHALGINPGMLVTYLKHGLDQSTPAEIVKLRAIYSALKDGEATWADVMGDGEAAGEEKTEPQQTKSSKTKDLLEQRRQEVKKQAAPAPDLAPSPAAETKPATPATTSGADFE